MQRPRGRMRYLVGTRLKYLCKMSHVFNAGRERHVHEQNEKLSHDPSSDQAGGERCKEAAKGRDVEPVGRASAFSDG